ncbi:MAG: FkbM family methyltransferase [Gammaproteobacteria bacterium]|nr:FkbM family methyltransferase [Gammaproteobacteria bacterium]MDH5629577.1 FkbM family methyltransferase [Gammaproteobacteria bacterium]
MKDLQSHITEIIKVKLNHKERTAPLDYFSWGRDTRHMVDDTERLPGLTSQKQFFIKVAKKCYYFMMEFINSNKRIMSQYAENYSSFNKSYQLMSDQYSRNLFAELILMKLTSEKKMYLDSFTQSFIDSYENSSEEILNSNESLEVYKWILRKVNLDNPSISLFTVPTILNLHHTGRLYRYKQDDVLIEVEGGDIVLDAGVGWGDTTIYLAAMANKNLGGHSYAFDILEEGINALSEQCNLNPEIDNITPVLKALSDKDGEHVNISSPSPGAKVVKEETERKIETISIDTFFKQNKLKIIDFVKMDIEGAEVPALNGAAEVIKKFKPKLAISVYHKWDDLLVIPQLIHSIRDDYEYYLDCTTGFGGETVLYCR